MDFDNQFSVEAPIDDVWKAMLDLERVAPCVPGASVTEKTGDSAYKVAIKVKLGPMSMTYSGDVEIVEADEGEHRAVMSAKAKESRGQGNADAKVEMRLTSENGLTRGTIHSDVAISGKAAAMGQGVIADVSGRLVETFAGNLAAMLAGETEAATPDRAVTQVLVAQPQPVWTAPEVDEGLPILAIVGGVVAARLRDPRTLMATLTGVAIFFYLLGRRRGSRW